MGQPRRASAIEMEVDLDADGAPRATSRESCSASRSVRAIFRAPLWVKRRGWPVSVGERPSFATGALGRAG